LVRVFRLGVGEAALAAADTACGAGAARQALPAERRIVAGHS
jgi:hypothetical protein